MSAMSVSDGCAWLPAGSPHVVGEPATAVATSSAGKGVQTGGRAAAIFLAPASSSSASVPSAVLMKWHSISRFQFKIKAFGRMNCVAGSNVY